MVDVFDVGLWRRQFLQRYVVGHQQLWPHRTVVEALSWFHLAGWGVAMQAHCREGIRDLACEA